MDTPKSTTEKPNRTRGLHRGTGSHKATCQCTFCKAGRYTQLKVSNDHNAAEVVRLAEALRLAEQGRDAALEKFRIEQDAAVRHAKEVLRLGAERDVLASEKNTLVDKLLGMEAQDGAMREELYALKVRLENVAEDRDAAKTAEVRTAELLRLLSIEHDALKQEKRTAEGRYVALLRRRSVEIAIVLVAGIGGALLFAIASMIGGTR